MIVWACNSMAERLSHKVQAGGSKPPRPTGGKMNEDCELQKRLVTARLTQILGSEEDAIVWMRTVRKEFADQSWAYHTANELIEDGRYDEVLALVGEMGGNV
jgi:hypothetical protein